MSNYASASQRITWNGVNLTDGYLGSNLSKAGDLQQMDIDLMGNACVSQLADQSGTYTITLRQGSEALKRIDQIAAGVQLIGDVFSIPFQGVITHEDPVQGASFVGWNACLVSVGDSDWAATAGERTVSFRISKVINTDDPISVLANIKDFVLK